MPSRCCFAPGAASPWSPAPSAPSTRLIRHPRLRPRVLIVPLAGFDAAGNRLGYGGGYYDRTLQLLRETGPVTAIGLAFACQQLPAIPAEPFDQPLDMIVTDQGVLTFAA